MDDPKEPNNVLKFPPKTASTSEYKVTDEEATLVAYNVMVVLALATESLRNCWENGELFFEDEEEEVGYWRSVLAVTSVLDDLVTDWRHDPIFHILLEGGPNEDPAA